MLSTSRLLDMRECVRPEWTEANHRITGLEARLQPLWFRPLFRLARVRRRLGYGHRSRLWEYPWALLSADLAPGMRVLDVGSGGSVFPLLLDAAGCEVYSADPTMDHARALAWGLKARVARSLGIVSDWGKPSSANSGSSAQYVADSIQSLRFEDGYFDRVFCLSVMEHIPKDEWSACMAQMSRVLSPNGRLVLTLDMSAREANEREYTKLLLEPSFKLVGEVDYSVPISVDDRRSRHGRTYETVGLVWDKV